MTGRRRWEATAPPPDGAVLEHLRAVLVDAGYTTAGLRALLHCEPDLGLLSFDPLVHARALPAGEPVAALITLLLFGDDVAERTLRAILGARALDALLASGLLDRDGDRVRATVEVHPWADLLLLCDPARGARHADQVLGITPASATLAHLTVRRRGGAALDLGTGCGTEALLAAGHSGRVVATDVNPRATAFAALNARLNGVTDLGLRVGDWFEPVAGEAFDLIVSNPPYVVSPDTTLVYRDAGLPGDEVCAQVVRDAAGHLAEGGFATVLSNWICRQGADPAEAPLRWAQGTGCDAIVLQFAADDPLTYAGSWNQHLRQADGHRFAQALDRWLDYFRALGVAAIGAGAVVLRRRSGGANWAKAVETPDIPSAPAGAQLQRLFGAHDHLAASGGAEGLLATALRPAAAHRIDHALLLGEHGYSAQPAVLREPASGLRAEIEPQLVGVLLACDGRRPLGELVAAATGAPAHGEDPVTRACLDRFARLVELGFLEPTAPRGD